MAPFNHDARPPAATFGETARQLAATLARRVSADQVPPDRNRRVQLFLEALLEDHCRACSDQDCAYLRAVCVAVGRALLQAGDERPAPHPEAAQSALFYMLQASAAKTRTDSARHAERALGEDDRVWILSVVERARLLLDASASFPEADDATA